MFCEKCGAKCAEGQLFCEDCGAPLNPPKEAAPQAQPAPVKPIINPAPIQQPVPVQPAANQAPVQQPAPQPAPVQQPAPRPVPVQPAANQAPVQQPAPQPAPVQRPAPVQPAANQAPVQQPASQPVKNGKAPSKDQKKAQKGSKKTGKKRGGFGTAVIIVLLVAAIGAVGFLGWKVISGMLRKTDSAFWELADGTFVLDDDLLLYVTDSDLLREGSVEVTLLWGKNVSEDLVIVDDKGNTLLIVPNDGSGYYHGYVDMGDEEDEGTPEIHVESGEYSSEPEYIYVHNEITGSAFETLNYILDGLEEFVLTMDHEDLSDSGAMQEVTAWLNEDGRVSYVEQRGGTILFVTIDGLAGSYTVSGGDSTAFGTEKSTEPLTAGEAYNTWNSTGSAASVTVSSDVAPTNSRIYNIAPAYGSDDTVRLGADVYGQILGRIPGMDYGQIVTTFKDITAQEMLLSGGYTDCAMLVLTCHGGGLTRSDGSPMAAFRIGYSEEGADIYKNYYNRFWVAPAGSASPASFDKARAILDLSVSAKGSHEFDRSIVLTGNYVLKSLGARFFDNTVIFLSSCGALCDDTFNTRLVHEHNASMLIGTEGNMYAGYGFVALNEIVEAMINKNDDGTYGPISKAGDAMLRDNSGKISDYLPGTAMVIDGKERAYSIDDVYSDFDRNTSPLRFVYRTDLSQNYNMIGEGTIYGSVSSSDSSETSASRNTLSGVEVTAYRWLDHTFTEYGKVTSDKKGAFRFDHMPVGVYVLTAKSTEYKDSEGNDSSGMSPVRLTQYNANCPIKMDVGKGASVIGSVIGYPGGEALSGAHVVFSGRSDHECDTDESGNFSIGLSFGEYTVTVSKEGYSSKTTKINVSDDCEMKVVLEKGSSAAKVLLVPRCISTHSGVTLALKPDGTVVAAGSDSSRDPDAKRNRVSGWSNIISVAVGREYSYGLKSDGTVVVSGKGLGHEDIVSGWRDIKQISAQGNVVAGLKKDGTVVIAGINDASFWNAMTADWTDIVSISVGSNCIVGLRRDGTVASSVWNLSESTWTPGLYAADWTNVVCIAAGKDFVIGLDDDGRILASGSSSSLELFDFSDWNDIIMVYAGYKTVYGIRADNTVAATGSNSSNQCSGVSGWTDIVTLSAYSSTVVGLRFDGTAVIAGEAPDEASVITGWTGLKTAF